MLRDNSFICIIPARGNSKGIKNKNIRLVAGKPLFYWAVKAALDSGIHDRVIVSSDSPVILKMAKKFGAESQKRPAYLAGDDLGVCEVLPYILNTIEQEDKKYDYVQLLEPTAPLITGKDILKAGYFLRNKEADMVISLCESKAPLGLSAPIPDDLLLAGWFPKSLRHKNRQQTKQTYQLDGNIYIAKWDIFAEEKDYWESKIYAYVMPASKYIDVDDETDLMIADSALKARYENQSFLGNLFGL